MEQASNIDEFNCLDNYMHEHKMPTLNFLTPPVTEEAMRISDLDASFNFVGLQLGLVRAELVRAIEQAMKAQGLSLRFTQFRVLARLFTLGPMSAGELARSLCHDAGAMTRLLDRLEAEAYLRRLPDPSDRRALLIELTPEGESMARVLCDCATGVLEKAQVALTQEERAKLQNYLQRMLITLRSDVFEEQVSADDK